MRKPSLCRPVFLPCIVALMGIAYSGPSHASLDSEDCGRKLEEEAPRSLSFAEHLEIVAAAYEKRVTLFITLLQQPEPKPSAVLSVINDVLANAWEVRAEIIHSGVLEGEHHAGADLAPALNSPLLSRLRNHRSQDWAESFEANSAQARAQANSLATVFDGVMADLTKLQARLRAGAGLPHRNVKLSDPSIATKGVQTRLTNDALARQWSEASDLPGGANLQLSRHFVFGISRDPIEIILRMTEKAGAAMAGAAVNASGPSGLLASPEQVANEGLLRISYVGPGARETNEAAGFVLDVPQENILTTSFHKSNPLIDRKLDNPETVLAERQILGPDELLRYSREPNELKVFGTHLRTKRAIKVVGVFLRIDERDRFLVSTAEVRWWVNYAADHHLPEPVLIRDHPYGWEKEQGSDLTIWLAARELVGRTVETNQQRQNGKSKPKVRSQIPT